MKRIHIGVLTLVLGIVLGVVVADRAVRLVSCSTSPAQETGTTVAREEAGAKLVGRSLPDGTYDGADDDREPAGGAGGIDATWQLLGSLQFEGSRPQADGDAVTGRLRMFLGPDRFADRADSAPSAWRSRFSAPAALSDLSELATETSWRDGLSFEACVQYPAAAARQHMWVTLALELEGRLHTLAGFPTPPPGAVLDLGTLAVLDLRTLSGRVLDPEGKPLEGAGIVTRCGGQSTWMEDAEGEIPAAVRTGPDGRFVLRLAAKSTSVLVYHSNYRPCWIPYVLLEESRGDLGDVHLKQGVAVRGRVRFYPDPPPEWTAYIEGVGAEQRQVMRKRPLRASDDGSFEVRDLQPGIYELRVMQSPGGGEVSTLPFQVADEEVDLGTYAIHRNAGVQFRVRGLDLGPGDHIEVEAIGTGDRGALRLFARLSVNEDGTALWLGLSSELIWGFTAHAPERLGGELVQARDVTWAKGELVDVPLEFHRGGVMRFRLLQRVEDRVVPLPSSEVQVLIVDGGNPLRCRCRADSQGVAYLPITNRDRVRLSVVDPRTGDVLSWSGWPSTLTRSEIVFESADGELAVRLRDASGLALSDLFVQLRQDPSSSAEVSRHCVRHGWTDSDGVVVFRGVPRGMACRLGFLQGGEAASGNGFIPLQCPPDFQAGAPGRLVEIRLRGRRARGEALRSGVPLRSVPVILLRHDGGRLQYARISQPFLTSASGSWLADDVMPGEYVLATIDAFGRRRSVSDPFRFPVSEKQEEVHVRFTD